jgi:hypothetical protein
MNLIYVRGEAAAKLGYVNAGTDRRVGGALGRLAGRIQSEQSFKSATPPTRSLEQRNGVYIEIATAPNGKPHISLAAKRGSRWLTVRFGWRYDPNWGDEGTLGYNPDPEIIGGYIFDGVIKLNAPQSFIEGVE